MRYAYTFVLALLVTGCATTAATEYPPDRAIGYWVGHPIEDVVAAWGGATEERIEGERHLYIWKASHYDSRYYPANLQEKRIYPYPGGREEIACKGVLEVNAEGKVVRAEWEGAECEASH